jgi:phosphoribosyl 1,2-cyclic phosphodiesterase
MTLRFTMLASGSRGNSTLVQADGFGVLIDAGLGLADLEERLREAGHRWDHVHAMLLTHTHTDHWNDATLSHLCKRGVPLYCSAMHHPALVKNSAAFARLSQAGLVHGFVEDEEVHLAPGLRMRAVRVRHDAGATFGFRLEGPADLFGQSAAVGYVADLGTWDDRVAEALSDVDLLAVEFNHDLDLERLSKRPAFLIARVLGDEGHLSNAQAAALVRAVLARSTPGRLRHLVQLHLSGECNKPALAKAAARGVVPAGVRVHTAEQHRAGRMLRLEPSGLPKEADLVETNEGGNASPRLPTLESR